MSLYKRAKSFHYNVKVLILTIFVCASASTPILMFEFANEMIEPDISWTHKYNDWIGYLILSCIFLGIYLTIKFENFVLKTK
tara:strand:- start:5765 stop:6010 length:246 start_codon:yes stop_codon:yes gene_type:complete